MRALKIPRQLSGRSKMEKERSSDSPRAEVDTRSRVVMDPRFDEYYWQWYPYWEHSCSWDYSAYNYNPDGFSGPLRVPSPRTASHTSATLSVPSDSDDSIDEMSSKDTLTTTQNVKEGVSVVHCRWA